MSAHLRVPSHQQIQIGSKVRIKKKKNVFHKTGYSSIWSEGIYEVTAIDKKTFPVVFYTNAFENKGFYSFQLLLVSDSSQILNSPLSEKIEVIGIQHKNSYLRNKKILPSRHEVSYIIKKDNETEFVQASDLLMYKKIFGNDILTYGPFFQQPENISYVI